MLKPLNTSMRVLLFFISILLLFSLLLLFDQPLSNVLDWVLSGSKYLSENALLRNLRIDAPTLSALQNTYPNSSFQERDDADVLHVPTIGLWASCARSIVSASKEEDRIDYLFLYDPQIRLGWLHIGIGSSRNLVEFAFLLDIKCTENRLRSELSHLPRHAIPNGNTAAGSLFTLGYKGTCDICFSFDAQDRVEYILIRF